MVRHIVAAAAIATIAFIVVFVSCWKDRKGTSALFMTQSSQEMLAGDLIPEINHQTSYKHTNTYVQSPDWQLTKSSDLAKFILDII